MENKDAVSFQKNKASTESRKNQSGDENKQTKGETVSVHLITDRPARRLSMPERTEWPVFSDLWPYVLGGKLRITIELDIHLASIKSKMCIQQYWATKPQQLHRP